MKLGTPIGRYGGKAEKSDWIVPRLPRARLFLDVFFGAGGVFFAVPEGTYPVEVVNDLDNSLVTFFRVLRERPDELRRVLQATPYSRVEFDGALEHSDDPLEEARRVWIRARQSVNGVGRRGTWARPSAHHQGRRTTRGEAKIEQLDAFAARLRRVAIECRDGIDLVSRYAQPDVAMYLDPPYLPITRAGTWGRDGYRHELSHEDHVRLLGAAVGAARAGARIAISGYRSDLYDEALVAWRSVELLTHANAVTPGRAERRTEVLWMSYPAELEFGAQRTLPLEARP